MARLGRPQRVRNRIIRPIKDAIVRFKPKLILGVISSYSDKPRAETIYSTRGEYGSCISLTSTTNKPWPGSCSSIRAEWGSEYHCSRTTSISMVELPTDGHSPPLEITPAIYMPTTPQELSAIPQEGAQTVAQIESYHTSTITHSMRSNPLWYCQRAPIWNSAVKKWAEHNHDDYERMKKSLDTNSSNFLQFEPAAGDNKESVARIKRWLPVLSGVRSIAMSFADLDPYKIAPVVCSSIFSGIDILLNTMHPEDRDKILNILFESGNTINEGISFETNFSKRTHPSIETNIKTMESDLSEQYLQVLMLVSDIKRQCSETQQEFTSSRQKWEDWIIVRGRNLWRQLTNKILSWESEVKEINRKRSRWSSWRKVCEEKLSRDDHIRKVLDWIETVDDPQPTLKTIGRRVMPDNRYQDAGKWFLDGHEFTSWRNTFQNQGRHNNNKRVLWVKGSYGTGKTTLLYHAYTALENLPEFHLGSRNWRVVQYFCDATNPTKSRPTIETIVRSLACRLSLQSDLSLSTVADSYYNKYTSSRSKDKAMDSNDWLGLFHELLEEGSKPVEGLEQQKFVFLIDALDECEGTQAHRFLDLMRKVMEDRPNVYLLCSSHQQVSVGRYFNKEILKVLHVRKALTKYDMRAFISGELESRKASCKDSIFYQSGYENLLGRLQLTLIRYACGMFRWVQIWLDVFLPPYDDLNTIRRPEDAEEHFANLKSDAENSKRQKSPADVLLESGYQRLWDLNSLSSNYYHELRVRLFRLVLASIRPLKLADLREALRINDDKYDESLSINEVRRLYLNFLYTDDHGLLLFVHDSARRFILHMALKQESCSATTSVKQFSMRQNHLSIARLYINVMKDSNHPFWKSMHLDLSKWNDITPDYLNQNLEMWKHPSPKDMTDDGVLPWFHIYLARYGLTHCSRAAEKHSVFDPLWTEILDLILLSPNSALSFTLIAELSHLNFISFSLKETQNKDQVHGVGQCKKQFELLYSHALAHLDLVNKNDVLQILKGFSSMTHSINDPRSARQQLFFKHTTQIGYNFWSSQSSAEHRYSQGATTLQIACMKRNPAAVNVFLQAVDHQLNSIVDEEFLTYNGRYGAPISIILSRPRAEHRRVYEIVFLLLKFETKWRSMIDGGAHRNPKSLPSISKQWSIIGGRYSQPAFLSAVRALEENEICNLLRISQPHDIDIRDEDGNTILHMAAINGYLTLFRLLVEEYGAHIDAQNYKGLTPYFFASCHERKELMAYMDSYKEYRIPWMKFSLKICKRRRLEFIDLGFRHLGTFLPENEEREEYFETIFGQGKRY